MKKNGITLLILEDEILLAEDLKLKLEELNYEVVATAQSGEDAITLSRKFLPDLAILDIEVDGEMNGLEVGAYIKKSLGIPIIYLTQFSDLNTFDKAKKINPSSYLTKPVNLWDLVRSIELSIVQESMSRNTDAGEYLLSNALFLRSTDQTFEKVPIEDISYFKAAGAYTEVYTSSKTFVFSDNISYFDKKLRIPQLIRIHRSWIINVDKVERIEENVLVIAGERVPIGKTYKKTAFSYFNRIK